MKVQDVKRAVVLAAGFGTRLRPLTLVEPKPLLPMWGVPMLERILSLLESWGVEEIVVNAHWQAEKIRAYAARRRGPAKVTVAEEPEILGRRPEPVAVHARDGSVLARERRHRRRGA